MKRRKIPKARAVDVLLTVMEPGKPSENTVVTVHTYSDGNARAQNRARARERINRPEGTRIVLIDSGPSGCFDDRIDDGPSPGSA